MRAIRTTVILLGAVALSGSAVAGSAAGAAAADPADTVPVAVGQWFAQEALPLVLETAAPASDPTMPDYSSADAIGSPHRLWGFSADFIAGTRTDRPLAATGDWIASIEADGTALGYISAAYATETGRVDFVGYSDAAELGSAIARRPATARIVVDGATSTWIAVDEQGLVSPLIRGASSADVAPGTPVDDYQRVLAARYAALIRAAAGQEASAGGGGGVRALAGAAVDPRPIAITGVLAAAVLIAVVALILRRRRSVRGPRPVSDGDPPA